LLAHKSHSSDFSVKLSARAKSRAFLGGVLLVIASAVSFYWGLVGLDCTLQGFDWAFLWLLGLLSFGLGVGAGLLSLRRRNQALVIFAENAPILTNLIFVKISLDSYGLATPWPVLIPSLLISIVSAFLVCNAVREFNSKNIQNSR
jgi:peptidoglycan/LPS O-acetylase OafA/YrhL